MTGIDEQAIARRLEAAAAEMAWPATPDLRSAVVARITVADAPPAPDLRDGVLGRIRARPAGRTLRPLLLAVALALAVAGLAVGLGFRLPGVEIERVAVTPSAGAGVDLGSPIPIAEALAATEPLVRVPEAMPPPDGAWTHDAAGQPVVTLGWRAAGSQPAIPGSDLALTLMAVPGSADEPLLHKVAGPGTRIEPVDVNGEPGWWLSGAPHELFVRQPDGDIGIVRSALAGDTLLFARDGTLYRLESALGKDATLEIARSMP